MSLDLKDLLTDLEVAEARREHAAYLPQVTPRDSICLHLGYPDPKAFPIDGLRAATEAVFRDEACAALQYCEEPGDLGLRDTLAARSRLRRENMLVTQGTTEAIEIVIRLLLRPGDVVVMEAPAYLWAIRVFKYAGARLIGVPVDRDGMRTDLLEAALCDVRASGGRVKFIYTVPDNQNPSGATMSLDRRRELLRVAAACGVFVLEDNPYHDLQYIQAELPTLRQLDEAGTVISARSFSKVLGPGVRLGWIEAHEDVMPDLVRMKQTGSCTIVSRIVDRFMKAGAYEPAISSVRRIYAEKHAAMSDALSRFMPSGVSWDVPVGGFYFWLHLPATVDIERLFRECAEAGLLFLKGDDFFCDTVLEPALRLSLSFESPARITEGVRRLGAQLARHCC